MCGIAGIRLTDHDRRKGSAVLTRTLDMIRYRGPDDKGEAYSGSWHIGMARLAILDPTRGVQPMRSSNGNWLLVMNGEIYNFLNLREELSDSGVALKTRNDAEVLVELIAQRGVLATLEVIEGMFAFAAVDQQTDDLWLCRDRFGEKPLYIDRRDGGFAFCSELTPLLVTMPASHTVCSRGLATIFRHGYPWPGFTAFKGIGELQPGCWLRQNGGGDQSSGCYWEPPHAVDEEAGCLERSGQKLLDLLQASVRDRLLSDVPLGLFLSGGIDSAGVAQAAVTSRPEIEAVTVGFKDAGYDERPLARATARYLGVQLHEEEASGARFSDAVISDLLLHYGQPFADSSAIPTRAVSKIARNRFKVVISGDGGDELLGGYPSFKRQRLFTRWGGGTPGAILSEFIRKMLPTWGRFETFHRAFTLNSKLREGLFAYASDGVFTDEQVVSLFEGCEGMNEVADQLAADREEARRLALRTHDPLLGLSLYQLRTSLPQDMLTKIDRMSMAESLEVRAPFLDSRLAVFCLALPAHLKLNGDLTKIALRHALRGRLPQSVIEGPKHGFELPLRRWMGQEFWDRLLHEVRAYAEDSAAELNPKALLKQVEQDRERSRVANSYRALHRAWLIYVYLNWRRLWFSKIREPLKIHRAEPIFVS